MQLLAGGSYWHPMFWEAHISTITNFFASSRNKKKIWWFSKYGPPKYRVPITAPLPKTVSFTPKYVFLHNYSEFFFNMIFIKHSAIALYKKKINFFPSSDRFSSTSLFP